MNPSLFQDGRPAETLAKSLLDVWQSGDRQRLRLVLENLSALLPPPESNEDFERIALLKCIAWRMKQSGDLLTKRPDNPQVGVWFNLLRHLSSPPLLANGPVAGFSDSNSVPAVVRH
jgi:hypothetical protein